MLSNNFTYNYVDIKAGVELHSRYKFLHVSLYSVYNYVSSARHSIRHNVSVNSNVGRVDIWSDNNWKPICYDDGVWTTDQSSVTCRQLGYSHVLSTQGDKLLVEFTSA